jgi:itaconyl-CoA hydratase
MISLPSGSVAVRIDPRRGGEVLDLSHLAPVHHGDILWEWSQIVDRRRSRSRPADGIVTVDTRAVNQHGTRVIEFRRTFVVPCRDAAG